MREPIGDEELRRMLVAIDRAPVPPMPHLDLQPRPAGDRLAVGWAVSGVAALGVLLSALWFLWVVRGGLGELVGLLAACGAGGWPDLSRVLAVLAATVAGTAVALALTPVLRPWATWGP